MITMGSMVYSCPFVPAEWIAAHGLHPRRIRPRSPGCVQAGVCPYARAFVGAVLADDRACGVIVTTVCDQMRRAADVLVLEGRVPVFLMHVPTTWQTPAAQRYYLDELRRLGRFLTRLGGAPPSDDALAKVMLDYDEARSSAASAGAGQGVPLALLGGPLFEDECGLFDLVEDAGGRIVLDASETGERTRPAPFDRRRLREEPLLELADAYFGHIPDAFRRPDGELHVWLARELDRRLVRGIVFRRCVWCDTWAAELGRLKEWVKVPVLDLDADGGDRASRDRTAGRLRAFVEMLT